MVSSKFLHSLKEEKLLTSEGKYKEDYVLGFASANERVSYINHGNGPNWMWMYDIQISKFGVCILFTDFQFTVLE